MKAQSIVFAVVGVFFGLIVGWILGSQQGMLNRAAVPASAAQQSSAPPAKTVDENEVARLRADIQREPDNARSRVALGNLYYDAERFDEAAKWYEEALKLDPKDPNVSTDLGMAYFYLDQTDRALLQFDYSLSIDPAHKMTLLQQGRVLAFGKQDLQGAAASWQKIVQLAPDSPEGREAKRMLDGLKSAHPEVGGGTPSTPRGGR